MLKACSLRLPWPSINTKFLLISKFFSKKTSTYPTENKFLSDYSNTLWLIVEVGNKISFINYDFPIGNLALLPTPKLKTPNPSSMVKAISGMYYN